MQPFLRITPVFFWLMAYTSSGSNLMPINSPRDCCPISRCVCKFNCDRFFPGRHPLSIILLQDPTPNFIMARRRIWISSLVHPGDKEPFQRLGLSKVMTRFVKSGSLLDQSCHPCAGAMLIFSVSFQF